MFIAVDSGKYNTKVQKFDAELNDPFKFRTKISSGTFDDDMFDKGTMIVQIDDGPVYKVGSGAKTEPDMETTKKTEIHRVCTITAAALAAGAGKHDINIAIGMPLSISEIPEERIQYKDYILGGEGEEHVVHIKTECDGPVLECRITFNKRFVYPEGIGVLYEYPSILNGPTAILDIGNLNINCTYADRFTILTESSFTGELGGKILISGLAQELTSELGARVDENLVASTLLKNYEDRYLTPKTKDSSIQEKSRAIIDAYLLEHVKAIKKKCDTKHWPLEFMDIVCIGGTTKLIGRELREVFGENVFIPEHPEYTNVSGFLKRMCAGMGVEI